MSVFKRLFQRKLPAVVPAIPPWDEIVEHMQESGLSCFTDQVVRVIPSKDRSKRIIILQSDNGYYKTVYEVIRVFDEDEWNYYCNDPDRYPAWWEPVSSPINGRSFYGTEDDAIRSVQDSFEYCEYFA